MRLEITDLKDDEEDSGGGDADHRKGGKSTSSRSGSADFENWAAVESSDDEESDDAKLQLECRSKGSVEKGGEAKGVSMKDDILTAVKEDPIIAPLPSRLSFCLSPKHVNEELQAITVLEQKGATAKTGVTTSLRTFSILF